MSCYYASVGGATRHTVVRLCMYVCMYLSVMSVWSVSRISRRSLKTKRWNLQHNLKSIFAWKWIVRILVIRLCSWVIAWLLTSRSPAGDLVADVTTKLSIAGCLTASEFAFTIRTRTADLYMKLRSSSYWRIADCLPRDRWPLYWRSGVLRRQNYPQFDCLEADRLHRKSKEIV